MKRNYSALMAMALLIGGVDNRFHNSPTPRNTLPWDHVNLTKAERKGKTYEEVQELRRMKWEDAGGHN